MYVIFPADELICMTYGAAVPRFKPRPTLDNLREPLVPLGTRPSPSRNALVELPPPSPSSARPPRSPIISLHSYPASITNSYDQREQQPNSSSASQQHLLLFDDGSPTYMSASEDLMYSDRERSPSLYYEPYNNHQSNNNNSSNSNNNNHYHSPISPHSSKTNLATAGANKKKHKLHINLGRLGRSNPAQDHQETARIREDHNLHIANPTFTRENLRQRNYDAFFESGEPVYSLEKRQTPQVLIEPETPVLARSGNVSPTYYGGDEQRPHSLGLFHRSKSPSGGGSSPTATLRAKSVDRATTYKDTGKPHRSIFGWRGARGGSQGPQGASPMASATGVLKELSHPSLNDVLKSHNGTAFKLVKTVADFTETLSQLYEQHAEALQVLVSNYRKKNGELRKERPACQSSLFLAWETLLQEIEADSQSTSDVAAALSRQVARPIIEKSFHRKVQSRKIFTHRESFDTIIAKTEEKLSKCRLDYKQCFITHRSSPTQHSMTQYIDAHNAYVQQLHATNAMLEAYHGDTVPQLLQELEEIYNDLCGIVSETVFQGADTISTKASEQAKRYEGLATQCKSISGQQDLGNFVRVMAVPPNLQKIPKKPFTPPQPADNEDVSTYGDYPIMRNELVVDRGASLQVRPSLDALKREAADIELQIRQLQDTIEAQVRSQMRVIESQLFSKANELQEDISMKKFDLRAKQLHLAAVKAQRELFLGGKSEPRSPSAERKLSTSSSSSMKTKWLKALRSLKPAGSSSSVPVDKKNGSATNQMRTIDSDNHNLQEYTYKKITPCDVCSQVLRGHTRQGLRCRICKVNVHADCAPQLPKCQAKQKLLRRQKSTSEIENRIEVDEEKPNDIDQIYQVLKKANEISNKTNQTDKVTNGGGGIATNAAGAPVAISINVNQQQHAGAMASGGGAVGVNQDTTLIPIVNVPECPPERTLPRKGTLLKQNFQQRQPTSSGLTAPPTHTADMSSSSAPHSPRRQKLNLRMKSLSLDSPESSELHGQIRRRTPGGPSAAQHHGGSGGALESTPPSNNSRLHSPSSPSHQRKLLYAARNIRTGSVDLPDEMEKSLSSASTSPCPSPKSHRLLPTNLYVVLYNFKARHQDELDLKAGYKVTVIETSDPDWWRGKCLGRLGYFPSKYCTKLAAGEKALQVTHNLQVADGERADNTMTLLRDQIVIQVGEEVGGMVMVRSAENRQGVCPVKYLQEV